MARGGEIYAAKCGVCHGAEGQGVAGTGGGLILPYSPGESWPPYPRTVGNYWPYATTLFDYINRAMPANAPGSLQSDEVYSLVAWLLFQNRIIPSSAVIDARSLPLVKMPALERFVPAQEVTTE